MRRAAYGTGGLLLLAASWPGWAAELPPAGSPPEAPRPETRGSHLFNPAGDSLQRGNGELGRLLGLPANSALTLGGEWIGNGTSQIVGGWADAYKRNSLGQAAILDLRLNLERAGLWPGGQLWVQGLQYNVSNNGNNAAGSVQQINNLISVSPFNRTELYTYGITQKLFNDQVTVSLGKLFAGYYFSTIARPIPDTNPAIVGGPNTNLLFLPPYSQPTFVGREPGYPDSTLGGVITLQPEALAKRFYLTLGVFDGRAGVGPGSVATGLQAGGNLLGPLLTMAEAGAVWTAGAKQLPGLLAGGLWSQSGKLTTGCQPSTQQPCAVESRATGTYAYAVQTLAAFRPQQNPGKVVSFVQGGYTPSKTNMMTTSLSTGVEVVAPFAERPRDSYGLGLSWAKLNNAPAAYTSFNANEVMVQLYGRLHLGGSVYAQPVVSWLPVVGFNAAQAPSTSVSLQLSTQF